jgi:hypothetical protein
MIGVFLTAPLYHYRFNVIPLFNITLMRILLLPLSIFLVTAPRQIRVTARYKQAVVLFLALLIMAAIQTVRSQFAIAWSALLTNFEGALLIWAVTRYSTTPTRLKLCAKAFCASALFPICISIYQLYGYFDTGRLYQLPFKQELAPYIVNFDDSFFGGISLHRVGGELLPRIASTLVDANYFAVFLSSAVIICYALVLGTTTRQARSRAVAAFGIAFPFLLGLLLATMSRSSWCGLLIGLFYVTAIHASHKRATAIRQLAGLMIVLVLLGSLWIANTASHIGELALARLQDQNGIAGRAMLIEEGWRPFLSSPLFGIGRANLISYSGYPTAHSVYLTVLFENGIAGLSLCLLAILGLWIATRPALSRGPGTESSSVALGARGALLSLLAANLLYDHLFSTEVNYLVFGLAFAAARLPTMHSAPRRIEHIARLADQRTATALVPIPNR